MIAYKQPQKREVRATEGELVSPSTSLVTSPCLLWPKSRYFPPFYQRPIRQCFHCAAFFLPPVAVYCASILVYFSLLGNLGNHTVLKRHKYIDPFLIANAGRIWWYSANSVPESPSDSIMPAPPARLASTKSCSFWCWPLSDAAGVFNANRYCCLQGGRRPVAATGSVRSSAGNLALGDCEGRIWLHFL